ncbi:MG2 domain-containing protein [Mucilaginibacter sp. PAMB04168]|uniref:carboxypeptidase-like regulatory domain-containing protein n=1 Tax=Mucilaginibacter sp. PAMB04168 TaxID=3138567 RepID=UPI0031F6B67F
MKRIINCVAFALLWVTVLPVFAQNQGPQKEVKLFFEKVYLHTDRQLYAPGDDIWFKAYLLNAQTNQPLNTSKNLYVELITPANKIAAREIIALTEGLGKGDFKLRDSLAAGSYRLRAYTNWMRNFGDNFVFEKPITIISTNSPAKTTTQATGTARIQFLPEGGSLVEGLGSIIAVKAEMQNGQGVGLRGAILSSQGDTVAHFSTDSLGMGLFTLLPFAGQTYQVKILNGMQVLPPVFPKPLSSGLTLKVLRKDTATYAVITCNEKAIPIYTAQTLTLKARSFGRLTYQQSFQLKGNTAVIAIPSGQLPAGIASLTLYDGEQKPNCERLMYIDNKQNANLMIKTDKPDYTKREKVVLDINTTDNQGHSVPTHFSLTAVDATTVPADESNIIAYLMLQSELRGTIKHAARYFDTTNVQRQKQLDLLLLTHGWRDFIWKRLADTTLRIAYIPEQGISLSGSVKLPKQGTPITGANITLIAPKAVNGRLFSAQTNAQGKYFFDNMQLYGSQSLRLNAKDIKGKSIGLISLDSLNANYPDIKNTSPDLNSPAVTATKAEALLKQATLTKQRSLSDTLIRLKEVEVKNKPKQVLRDRTITDFGYKDEVLTVTKDDYRYNTLRDYIQFASKQARVDASSNRLYFMADGQKVPPRIVLNNREAMFSENDPDDVIDLISNSYYDLPVTAIEKVVIKKAIGGPSLLVANTEGSAATAAALRPAGASASSLNLGVVFIIYITLKPQALRSPEPGAMQAAVNGYYEARTFYSPAYNPSVPDSRQDLRATLHWEPNGNTNASGHSAITFFNTDNKTTVRVIVQGITSTGIPVAAVKTYTVK